MVPEDGNALTGAYAGDDDNDAAVAKDGGGQRVDDDEGEGPEGITEGSATPRGAWVPGT